MVWVESWKKIFDRGKELYPGAGEEAVIRIIWKRPKNIQFIP